MSEPLRPNKTLDKIENLPTVQYRMQAFKYSQLGYLKPIAPNHTRCSSTSIIFYTYISVLVPYLVSYSHQPPQFLVDRSIALVDS